MTQLVDLDTNAEIVRAMHTDETVEAPEAGSSPPSGKHRAGKPGKPAKAPKAPKAPKASKVGKAPAAVVLEESAAASDDAVTTSRRPARRSWLRLMALPVVALLTVGFFVAALVMHLVNQAPSQRAPLNAATRAALSQANHDVKDILSYDYRKIDSDVNTAKAEITGQLLTDYNSTATKLLKQAASIKAIVTATVSAQAVESADHGDGRVTVLMYIDQESVKQLAGQKTPSTRIDPLRVRVTMNKVHGAWKASNLEPV
jgi:Mce-associated membrane protein